MDDRLIGLGNAISDGHLVVYYPHLLVDPEYQRKGIGSQLMKRLMAKYEGFHQHVLIADGRAIDFYRKVRALPGPARRNRCGSTPVRITKPGRATGMGDPGQTSPFHAGWLSQSVGARAMDAYRG